MQQPARCGLHFLPPEGWGFLLAQPEQGNARQVNADTHGAQGTCFSPSEVNIVNRMRRLFDDGWKFLLQQEPAHDGLCWVHAGDMRKSKKGVHPAYKTLFAIGYNDSALDDSGWRNVAVPHDWTIEQDISPEGLLQNGFLKPGIGWYRKCFDVPEEYDGRRIYLEFDGIFRNCTLWVNDMLVAMNQSGYVGFHCDISDVLNYGKRNVVAVRVDATKKEGVNYEGAGIYRHVWLLCVDPLHVDHYGTFVRTRRLEAGGMSPALLDIETDVMNEGGMEESFLLVSEIYAPDGTRVAVCEKSARVRPGAVCRVQQEAAVDDPLPWSLEERHLYRLVSVILKDGNAVDRLETSFGIRSIRFDPESGFFLNGKPTKIKGVCCIQEHTGVGCAIPEGVLEYRIGKLKDVGCNAYRYSHNPMASELLDICDRQGMLVMAENRSPGVSELVMGNIERMVKRDRNHPSVILWSLANEEFVIQGLPMAKRIASRMMRRLKLIDDTRPVTAAVNRPEYDGFCQAVDVLGVNYFNPDELHALFPKKSILYSESGSMMQTRGIYETNDRLGFLASYDQYALRGHEGTQGESKAPARVELPDHEGSMRGEEHWNYVAKNPFIAGTFLWSGFDYRGEPSPYKSWPFTGSHFGLMDSCGFPKDSYYYYKSWWTGAPVLHVFPHWNWAGREGEPLKVWCYSNCDSVELYLNGRSLGKKTVPEYSHVEWMVPYEPGVLHAEGFRAGQVNLSARVETTGAPASVRLEAESVHRNLSGSAITMVKASAVDEKGLVVPSADSMLLLDIKGNGEIIGLGNGNPSSLDPEKGAKMRLFNGLGQIIVLSGSMQGQFHLKASSFGLLPGVLTADAQGHD